MVRRISRFYNTPLWNKLMFPPMILIKTSNSTTLANATSSANSQSLVRATCALVCESYYRQAHVRSYLPKLNLSINHESLTDEQAISVVASLANEAGSMVALGFFYWAIGFHKFRHFMRFYIVCAKSLVGNGNLERAREVGQCMVSNFAEVGRLSEGIGILLELQNEGLVIDVPLMNSILGTVSETGCVDYADKVFDEMCRRGVHPDSNSYKLMVIAYCRAGQVREVDAWLGKMIENNFRVDNATLTLIIKVFSEKGLMNRAIWVFQKMISMGLSPNLINFTCLINGLCKKGNIKQAFEVLEEMVRKGWKPNIYTHTVLIDGLCKKGWIDKAFRLFLKLVRSEKYKPNVHTYTAMINGYCKEEKLNRAEMLLGRMREQGLVPNLKTCTTLIDAHCKAGNFDRAHEYISLMSEEGLSPNICTYNALIDGLSKKGRFSEASNLLNKLDPDIFTYTILIHEQCKRDSINQAMAIFCRMQKTGIEPDIHIYTTLISSLCRQRRMKESESLFEEAVRFGLFPTKQTYTSMICGYCRDGNSLTGLKFLHKMTDPDSITYGALISGLCKESKLKEARRLYDTMLDKGLSPCEVTRLTIAYEYCKIEESATALVMLDRLDRKLWVRTVRTLVRKLCSEKKVGMATLFFHRLVDREPRVDRVTLAAFTASCYESNKSALVLDLKDRISKGIG